MNSDLNSDSAEPSGFLSDDYNVVSELNTSKSELNLAPFNELTLESSVADMHRSFHDENDGDFENSRYDENEEQSEEESQLPSATADAMETYFNIAENIYCGSATGKSIAEESMPCECKYLPEIDEPNAACGDDNYCINRMMFMECTVEDCPCGRYCRNRRFQLRQYARVDVIRTDKKGFGLRALTDLPSNAFIMEYIGEVIPNQEFIRRTKEYEASGLEHYYFMTLKTDEIIDATKKGCLARFINHSCNPNCVTQKWVVGKHMRIGIYTNRCIKAGEELTFDYKFERYGAQAQICYCGELACKGFIGGSSKTNGSTRGKAASSNRVSVNEEDDDDEDDDRKQSDSDLEEAVTLTQKRMLRKMNRRNDSLPLQNPDEVKSFVKRMLDSVGKSHLVMRLLHRLELTDKETSLGREIFKRFIRLHGLKMLKFWLGEWKNDREILVRVFHVLSQLSFSNRNGLEDCKMFEIVEKFVSDEDSEISTLAAQLLKDWEQLKTVYRIPKRNVMEPPQPLDEKTTENNINNTEETLTESHRSALFESSREFFDPDDDYFEYFSVNVDIYEIQWKLEYPPRSAIPTASRVMTDTCAKNSYYGLGRPSRPLYSFNPHHSSSIHNPEQTPSQSPAPYNPHYRNKSGEYYIQFNDNQSIDSTSVISTQSPPRKLPLNWKSAHAEDGSIYYYHRFTNKTQWNFPEEKSSSIEGVNQTDLESLVEKTIQGTEKKRAEYVKYENSAGPIACQIDNKSPRTSDLAHRRGSIEVNDTLNENELKKAVGKIVIKHLSSKPKELWNGDKHLFKELARKITHHIVDREIQSSRKIQSINSSIRSKIEKFIDSHGADLVNKLTRKRKRHPNPATAKEMKQMLVDSPRSITSEDTNKCSKEAFSPSTSPFNNTIASVFENGSECQSEKDDFPNKKRISVKIDAFANILSTPSQNLANLENIMKNDEIIVATKNMIEDDQIMDKASNPDDDSYYPNQEVSPGDKHNAFEESSREYVRPGYVKVLSSGTYRYVSPSSAPSYYRNNRYYPGQKPSPYFHKHSANSSRRGSLSDDDLSRRRRN